MPRSVTLVADGSRKLSRFPLKPALWRGLAIPLVLLAALEIAGRLGWVPNYLMPMPSELLATLLELAELHDAHPI